VTAVRLAVAVITKGEVGLNRAFRHGLRDREDEETATGTRYRPPALLVSWWYWKAFAAERPHYSFRDYSLDSGAWSAYNSGAKVDFPAFIDGCKELLATDPQCAEVFALDVIGDWRASLANTERMWEEGVPAIPTYHIGEPEHVLLHLAAAYPKIAIGGAVGLHLARKKAWVAEVFARVWPKPVHGLGMNSEQLAMAFPFHSIDATNWELAPAAFGNWKSMPGASIRGGNQPLRMEVEWYLRLEERVQARWRRETAELDAGLAEAGFYAHRAAAGPLAPAVRMAVVGTTRSRRGFGEGEA
jgi:hypothetical protein